MRKFAVLASMTAVAIVCNARADVITVEVTFENLAPLRGTWQTPVWVGFHNGSFDTFNLGESASPQLERLAEDGTIGPLNDLFQDSGHGMASGVLGGAPIAPGGVVSTTFSIDTGNVRSRYFSYASMVIPSNDAFVGNHDQRGHRIIDDEGNFVGADFFIAGRSVLDAGTEVNDEIPENTAFFGQMNPNTGDPENGVIRVHEGYFGSFGNPGEEPRILADPMFTGADFTLPDYPIARITVRVIPAPAALFLLGAAGLITRPRRRMAALPL